MVFKKKSVFIKILIPMLLLGIFQSLLVGGAVLMGGTVGLLRDNARHILSQNLQNRQISLENDMVQSWSNLDECVEKVRGKTTQALSAFGMTLSGFQASGRVDALLNAVSGDLLDTMRKNSVTGIFLVLSNGEDYVYPTREQSFRGLYFRDQDSKTNPGDFSDVLMERGPASVAEAHHISLDSLWSAEYRFMPPEQGGGTMDYYFKPYLTARENPGLHYQDLGRWCEPFLLSPDGVDAEWVIAYSVPLLGDGGMPYGVLGVEISLDMLYEMMPSREVDASSRGGYILATYDRAKAGGTLACHPQVLSGNAMKQLVREQEELQFQFQPDAGIYKLPGLKHYGSPVYAAMLDLDLYNTNTPFSGQQWALAALINEEALYGIADNLERSVAFTTVVSLLIGVLCIYFVASRTARPLTQAAQRLRETGPEGLAGNSSGVTEVDELFTVIRDLNRRQKTIETDLKNERERYLLALESTTDIILEYDFGQDTLLIYHLEKEGGESRVSTNRYPDFRKMVETEDVVHPDDRAQVLAFLEGRTEELVLRSRSAGGGYRWFSAKGKAVYGDDGGFVRTIGSTRDVTAEKDAELKAMEANKRDRLTGLLKQYVGEDAVRKAMTQWPQGCLAILDLDEFNRLNEQFGMLYCDLLLEAISTTLQRCAGPDDILARYGGDEFLIYFAHRDEAQTLEVARQICSRVSMLDEAAADMRVSCSIGFAGAGGGYEGALSQATKALEYVKRHRRADAAGYGMLVRELGEDWAKNLPQRRRTDQIASLYFEADENIVSLAFNLFEKTSEVRVAIPMLLSKLARHFGLRRVAVFSADLDFYTSRVDYQWGEFGEARYDPQPEHYSAGAFRTLIERFGREGTLFGKTLDDECRRMLKWNEARVMLCCPMYDNGRYTGAVVFESDGNVWNQESIELVKEIVKLLSAHISKSRADLASRAKSEFLSRMSHEIRTPMNAIMGMTNIALCLPELPDKAGECLEKIDSSARYLLSLLNDILDMSKIESGKMVLAYQSFDLEKLLRDLDTLMRPQAEAKGLALQFASSLEDTRLIGDALRLNQILVNLLSNAVKFTGAGGAITVTVDQVMRQDNKAGVRFSVRDTGIGINPQQVARIFNAFEQEESDTAARYGGTGLGLSISSSLVRMMEGKLEVDTAPGKGSEFYFTVFFDIDHSAAAPEESRRDAPAQQEDLSGKRVLLVEDNELNIEIAREILQMAGMEVAEAHDGQQAVDAFADSPVGAFDAILMDIRMPVMDGLEATRIIRRMERTDAATVPIIAMTANAFDDDMRKSIESGMNGHLAKPFEIDKLMEMLGDLIRGR